jgi:hypothetical protein
MDGGGVVHAASASAAHTKLVSLSSLNPQSSILDPQSSILIYFAPAGSSIAIIA